MDLVCVFLNTAGLSHHKLTICRALVPCLPPTPFQGPTSVTTITIIIHALLVIHIAADLHDDLKNATQRKTAVSFQTVYPSAFVLFFFALFFCSQQKKKLSFCGKQIIANGI